VSPQFDELIHQRTRLEIMALLAAADWAEFAFVRDALELSDSALSKHLSALEGAGYTVVEGVVSGGRRRIRVRLSPTGRRAFNEHVAAVQKIFESSRLTE
jgi:DNA-binding transcriptional ArsR family regulator